MQLVALNCLANFRKTLEMNFLDYYDQAESIRKTCSGYPAHHRLNDWLYVSFSKCHLNDTIPQLNNSPFELIADHLLHMSQVVVDFSDWRQLPLTSDVRYVLILVNNSEPNLNVVIIWRSLKKNTKIRYRRQGFQKSLIAFPALSTLDRMGLKHDTNDRCAKDTRIILPSCRDYFENHRHLP